MVGTKKEVGAVRKAGRKTIPKLSFDSKYYILAVMLFRLNSTNVPLFWWWFILETEYKHTFFFS